MTQHAQQLLTLLEDSIEFAKLNNHFKRFNPFKILSVDQFEIRHSNFLVWMLNPKGNHNLGDFFLKKLLAKAFVHPNNLEDTNKLAHLNPLNLVNLNFQDVIVHKELLTSIDQRIDILAVSESNKTVILIENKFWSKESFNQLKNYLAFVNEKFEGYTIVPIYLTMLEDPPSEDKYLMLTYRNILSTLKDYVVLNEAFMNDEVYSFISYYIEVLADQLEENEELNQSALSIYQDHKDAVDLLYTSVNKKSSMKAVNHQLIATATVDEEVLKKLYMENKEAIDYIVKVGNSIMSEAFKSFAASKGMESDHFTAHHRLPSFVEKEWAAAHNREDLRQKWWLDRGLIAWFANSNNRLMLKVEVGPLLQEKRVELLQALQNEGILIRDISFEDGKKYTGIYTSFLPLSNWESKETISQAMMQLYENTEYQELNERIKRALSNLEIQR
ncbi:PD-(D/E)XK nuclease family protein [Paenisporosarcina sp. FSL H8-0542]|uniref:PDDEXK-like family protein n=1 Tax=Paenisporosarcina sp. FSL H8-0542 TaxID=2921401 RepID=UPI00315AD715